MLAGRFSGEVADVATPIKISGGFDAWVYGMHFAGMGLPAPWAAPLVVRIPAVPERFVLLERESRIQAWVAAQGYPAPPILELVRPGELFEFPVQVMKRMVGTTMAEAMTSAPWRAFQYVGQLAVSHASLHRVPVPEWVDTGSEWTLADDRLRLARYLVSNISPPGLEEALERTERLMPLLEMPGPVICHGDFHPANLIIDTDWLSVIDWTHAGIGDRHGDVAWTAWLFHFAAVAAPQYTQRLALRVLAPALSRAYLSVYRRHLRIDNARLRLWMPLNLLFAWAIIAADEQEVFHPSRAGRDFRAGLATWIRNQFWRHIKQLSLGDGINPHGKID
jgi:aminoglycoside phosphotransferase (APT) family kinase protein